MPTQFFLIGISCLVVGSGILIYTKFLSGPKTEVSTPVTVDEKQAVTDEEMKSNYRKAKWFFLGGWVVSAVSAFPAFEMTYRYGSVTMPLLTFAIGIALGLMGLWSIYKYRTDPEGYRRFLAKRWKRVED